MFRTRGKGGVVGNELISISGLHSTGPGDEQMLFAPVRLFWPISDPWLSIKERKGTANFLKNSFMSMPECLGGYSFFR